MSLDQVDMRKTEKKTLLIQDEKLFFIKKNLLFKEISLP